MSEAIPSGWDETELAGLERELTRHVGAVAKVLVRRAARGQADLAVVRQLVAASIIDPGVRQRFLESSGAATAPGSLPRSVPSSGLSDPPSTPPLAGGSLLTPQDVEKATAVLTRSLGPIAAVLVKRCAEGARTREAFMARVLAQVVDRVDAKVVEAELWRSMR